LRQISSCRPSGSFHMGRRLDVPLGLRMVLQEPQLPEARHSKERPSSDRHSSRCGDIRHKDHDESRCRIRQRLERPNCLAFDCQTAWLRRQLLKNRQQQQLERMQKVCSFVLSLNGRVFRPKPDLIGVCWIGKARPSTSGERRIERSPNQLCDYDHGGRHPRHHHCNSQEIECSVVDHGDASTIAISAN
jgi:hypothetical protein